MNVTQSSSKSVVLRSGLKVKSLNPRKLQQALVALGIPCGESMHDMADALGLTDESLKRRSTL